MGETLIFVSAGDPSGDIAASRLMAALHQKRTEVSVFGLGGDRLAEQGQAQLAAGRDLAVLGFWEVARRFRFFQRLMASCVAQIERRRPKVIVLVDYPGFNLRLAKRVRRLGIPIVYYIAPQVWAWGEKRVHEIKQLVDQLLVILPFEEKFFSGAGIAAKFVGHYLLEDIAPNLQCSARPNNGAIALLPGSRPQEIERMLVPMLEASSMYMGANGGSATVAAVKGAYDYSSVCDRFADKGVTVAYNRSREVIAESDLVIAASGTATLEAGIIGRPMVIVYKTGAITYQIARRVIRLDKIGLVNLVLDERVVPELIQNDASPSRIAVELERYSADATYRNGVYQKLLTLPPKLGGVGASDRAATEIGRYL